MFESLVVQCLSLVESDLPSTGIVRLPWSQHELGVSISFYFTLENIRCVIREPIKCHDLTQQLLSPRRSSYTPVPRGLGQKRQCRQFFVLVAAVKMYGGGKAEF